MANQSCINHKKQIVAIVRQDYLSICDNNHCAAVLLNVFEFWTNKNLAKSGSINDKEPDWIFRTTEELSNDILGLFGESKVSQAIKLLKSKGFIQTRRNPKFRWDRTAQYRLECEKVQEAIDKIPFQSEFKNNNTNPQNHDIEALKITNGSSESTEAIPEYQKEKIKDNEWDIPEINTETSHSKAVSTPQLDNLTNNENVEGEGNESDQNDVKKQRHDSIKSTSKVDPQDSCLAIKIEDAIRPKDRSNVRLALASAKLLEFPGIFDKDRIPKNMPEELYTSSLIDLYEISETFRDYISMALSERKNVSRKDFIERIRKFDENTGKYKCWFAYYDERHPYVYQSREDLERDYTAGKFDQEWTFDKLVEYYGLNEQ